MLHSTAPLRRGFTLIEVMAAVGLTAIVLFVAVTFYIQISTASQAAMESTREGRLGTAVLDRIARDLQGAFLIEKPAEMDPIEHPWFFVAESQHSGEGADHLLFVSTTQRPRAREHSTDVALVGYALEPAGSAFGGFELIRSVVPGRPEEFSDRYPRADDPGSIVLAEGLADFSLRFLGPEGEWLDRWNSAQLLQSSQLPQIVEIRVVLLPEDDASERSSDAAELPFYSRRVALPMRPVSQKVLFEGASFAAAAAEISQENPLGCDVTWGQCIAAQQPECVDQIKTRASETGTLNALQASSTNCFRGNIGANQMPACFDKQRCTQ